MSTTEPRPLPPLKPQNAAASAAILLEAGIPVAALRGVLTGAEIEQIEAAMAAAAGGAS